MDLKIFATVFTVVLIAELGDKTQLATLLFSANREASKLSVFAGASLALILASAIAVLAGAWVAEHVNERYLSYAAGTGFILIGLWTLLKAHA